MSGTTILVLPVYNESATVLTVLAQSEPLVDKILVIDDGSRDETRDLLIEFAATHTKLSVVRHPTNCGMSGALLTAFLMLQEAVRHECLAQDDIVITMDADGQHRPADLVDMVARLRSDQSDLVLGRRDWRRYPVWKRLGNYGLSRWASWWSGIPYRDAECGFRALTLQVLVDVLPYFHPRSYGCAQELAVLVPRRGWRVDNDYPIHSDYYRAGTRLTHGWNNALSAVRAWYRVRFHRAIPHDAVWKEYVRATGPLGHVSGPQGGESHVL